MEFLQESFVDTIMTTSWTQGTLLVCIIVQVLHWVKQWSSSSSPTTRDAQPMHTLYLRHLQQSGADMLGGCACRNMFVEELNLVSDLVLPKFDYCVMKALGSDIPLLSKQEHLHAKMHHQGRAERERLAHRLARWAWFAGIVDFFLLRCGRHVGSSLVGFVEATTGLWTYYMMILPGTKGFMSNEIAFHAFEELEHGPLTTQYLRKQVSPIMPLLLFPLGVAVYLIYFFAPPLMVLVTNPLHLVRLQTYVDFVTYYSTFLPVFVLTMYACITYWVLPFAEDPVQHQARYQYFQQLCHERGIQYTIVESATYTADGTLISSSNNKGGSPILQTPTKEYPPKSE